jgi:hypothetical protein
MSKIDFEKEINQILSQQKIFEEKLDVIIKNLKKYLYNRAKPMKPKNQQLEKKPKKKVKFVCGKH